MEERNELEKIIDNVTSTGVKRRLDELGRFIIPEELRRNFQMDKGTKVTFRMYEDYIILKESEEQDIQFTAQIEELGRILIPIEMRKALNWVERDLIEIYIYGSYIALRKRQI